MRVEPVSDRRRLDTVADMSRCTATVTGQHRSGRAAAACPVHGPQRLVAASDTQPDVASIAGGEPYSWETLCKTHPAVAYLVDAVGDLNDAEVEALREASVVQHGIYNEVAAKALEQAERAAIRAVEARRSDMLAWHFATDCQDDVARAHPDERMYDSEAILGANSALLAVVAWPTGALSRDNYQTLVEAWAHVDASIYDPDTFIAAHSN